MKKCKKYKSFQLGSHTVKVSYVKKIISPENGKEILGLCNPLQNKILVAKTLNGEILSEDAIEHSFYHELSHYLMLVMGKGDLYENEDFVDSLGMFLAQFTKTAK